MTSWLLCSYLVKDLDMDSPIFWRTFDFFDTEGYGKLTLRQAMASPSTHCLVLESGHPAGDVTWVPCCAIAGGRWPRTGHARECVAECVRVLAGRRQRQLLARPPRGTHPAARMRCTQQL